MFRDAIFRCLPLVFICLIRLVHGDLSEEDMLNRFLKIGFEEEEYGYVLEGAKPISVRDFYSLDDIPVYKDFARFKNEFLKTLLAQSALPIWNKHFRAQKTLVLKGVPLHPEKPTVTGFEVQFINIPKLKEVIAKNIDLFRFILSPTYSVEDLVELIAFSDKKLVDILKEDSTLIGIVLGFGSYNSIMGGRSDTLLGAFISRDIPPFAAKSAPMQLGDESSSFLPASCYGASYLNLAGGQEETIFQRTPSPIKINPRFLNATQELLALSVLEEPLPSCLREKSPGFVFGPYKGGPDNQSLFKQLKSIQKKLQPILAKQNFLEVVAKKTLRIKIKKPSPFTLSDILRNISLEQWKEITSEVATRFEDQNEKQRFFDSFHSPSETSENIPEMIGVSSATLKGIERARTNLKEANNQFKSLAKRAAKDTSLKTIVKERIYYETNHPGKSIPKQLQKLEFYQCQRPRFNLLEAAPIQVDRDDAEEVKGGDVGEGKNQLLKMCGYKTLEGGKRVRMGYVIGDMDGNVLFANYDTWMSTSEMITGLAHGIQGMQLGEKRTIYLHPTFGYGALTTLPPCITLKVEVHLLDFEETAQEALPPLTPFVCSLIDDPSYYRSVKSSCEKLPGFTGSFYGKLFNESEKRQGSVADPK